MARPVFKLFGMIGMKGLEKVEKDLKGVDAMAKKLERSLNKTSRNISKMGKNLSVKLTAPLVALAGTLTLLSKETGDYADKMLDLEQITGLTTDNLQKFELIAGEAGVSFDGFVGVIGKFQKRLPGIIRGQGAAADAMKKLGVNAKDSEGNLKDINSLFPEMLRALMKIDDVTLRNVTAQELFGRSLADLAPVLGMTAEDLERIGTEAEDMGTILDKDALNAANNFRVSMVKLQAQFTSVFRVIATKFIPILNDTIVPLIKNTVVPAILRMGDAVGGVIDWFTALPKGVKDTVTGLIVFVATMGPALMLVGKFVGAFKTLVPLLMLAKKGLILLSAVMSASPIGAVILLVMGLVAAIKLLEGNNEELKESFGGMWDSIVWYTDQAILHMRESFFKFARDVLRMLERTVGFAPGISAKIKKARRELLEMERAERSLRMSRKLARKETELSTKATDEMAKAITNAEKIVAKLVASQKQEAKVLGANTELLTNNGATAEEVANAKKDFEEGWTATLSREILNRKQLLEVERMNALDQADKLGAERNDIELYYSIERLRIAEDEEREKQRLENETADKRAEQLEFTKELTIQSVGDLLAVFSQFYGVQIAHVNKKKQIDIDAVNASVMGEEEKAAAIGAIEEESAAKLKELKRKQAIADKAHAILAIAINTAVAITNAFAQLGPIGGAIAAGVIGALGVAQAALVAAQPIPLAKGGLVKRTQGGVNAIIGEGKEDELVMPLETGVAKLADSLYSKVREMSFGGMGLPAMAGGGGTVQNHWNIGTLVADDRGIKELERRTRKFRIEEDQRRGLEN